MKFKGYMPDYIFEKTTNISLEFLKENNFEYLFLDVDNTLARHGSMEPAEGVIQWLDVMRENNIKLIITSNNFAKRVEPFANIINLDFVSFSAKPTPYGFLKAASKIKADLKKTLVVGDQCFTDVLGAHIIGMKVAMVLPVFDEKGWGYEIKKRFEQKYIDRYLEKNGDFL